MTVTNLYLVMAQEVKTDESDNLTSILKVIDRFSFKLNREQLAKDNIKLGEQVITLPATFAAAGSWLFSEKLKKATPFIFKISIVDPAGTELNEGTEQENSLPAGVDKFNMNFSLDGLTVTKEGKYQLRAEILSKEGGSLAKAEYPFEVVFES